MNDTGEGTFCSKAYDGNTSKKCNNMAAQISTPKKNVRVQNTINSSLSNEKKIQIYISVVSYSYASTKT